MSGISVSKAKSAALREAVKVYQSRANSAGGTFELGGFNWQAPAQGYDIIKERDNKRMPVDISQIVERLTGPRAINWSGDLDTDTAAVVAAVDDHLVNGQ